MHFSLHCGLEVATLHVQGLQHNKKKHIPGEAEQDIPQLLHHVLQEQQHDWSEA